MDIRQATLLDIDSVIVVIRKAFEKSIATYGEGPPGYDSYDNIKHHIENNHCTVLVNNGVVVGGAIVYAKYPSINYLSKIFIDPSWSGKGFGSKLLKYLFVYCENRPWILHAVAEDKQLSNFYSKLGFLKDREEIVGHTSLSVYIKPKIVPILLQFTGAQSTGKTTLIKALQEKYTNNVNIIGEASRKLVSVGAVDNIDVLANSDTQIILNSELMLQYLEDLHNRTNLLTVAERTPICCLAYGKHVLPTSSFSYMLQQLDRMVIAQKLRSDIQLITFYCPLLDSFEDDGFRYQQSQKMIDEEIKSILELYNFSYITLPVMNIADRLQFIEKILEKYIF